MKSKIIAARMATLSGIGVIIASGKDFSVLQEIGRRKKNGHFLLARRKASSGKEKVDCFCHDTPG